MQHLIQQFDQRSWPEYRSIAQSADYTEHSESQQYLLTYLPSYFLEYWYKCLGLRGYLSVSMTCRSCDQICSPPKPGNMTFLCLLCMSPTRRLIRTHDQDLGNPHGRMFIVPSAHKSPRPIRTRDISVLSGHFKKPYPTKNNEKYTRYVKCN